MKCFGIFRLGPCNGDIPDHIFLLDDLIENIDMLNAKSIKALAGDLFIEGRSKKKTQELRKDIINTLKKGEVGSDNLEDCIGSTPTTKEVITVSEFVELYY